MDILQVPYYQPLSVGVTEFNGTPTYYLYMGNNYVAMNSEQWSTFKEIINQVPTRTPPES